MILQRKTVKEDTLMNGRANRRKDKHNRHADKIEIALSKQGNNMKLLLADNGVGIEKEDLKHIFERVPVLAAGAFVILSVS